MQDNQLPDASKTSLLLADSSAHICFIRFLVYIVFFHETSYCRITTAQRFRNIRIGKMPSPQLKKDSLLLPIRNGLQFIPSLWQVRDGEPLV